MNQETEYLWELFCLYFANVPDNQLLQHIDYKYSELSGADAIVIEYIDNFSLTHDRISMERAILDCVSRRCFDVERHVQLVAVLVQRGGISLDVAADMLTVRGADKDRLSKEIEHVIDVAWLINEDRRDDIMSADADSLLKDALGKVATDFLLYIIRERKP